MQQSRITIEQVQQILLHARAREMSEKARERLTWLEHFCVHGNSVTETSRYFGIPRMTLYRALKRFDPANPLSLEDLSRRPYGCGQRAEDPVAGYSPDARGTYVPEFRQEQAQMPSASLSEHASVCSHPHCVFCGMKRFWRTWKRAFLFSSLFVNLAFIVFLLGTVLFESQSTTASLTDTSAVYSVSESVSHVRTKYGAPLEVLPTATHYFVPLE